MRQRYLALFIFGSLLGPAMALLWHYGRNELVYSAGLNQTAQLYLFLGLVFLFAMLFRARFISPYQVNRKCLSYAVLSTLWAFLASMPIAIFVPGPGSDSLLGRETDSRFYTAERVKVLHSQEDTRHFPPVSESYKIISISMQDMFLQAGGHAVLEVEYFTKGAFDIELERLIDLNYIPHKVSCGKKTEEEMLASFREGRLPGIPQSYIKGITTSDYSTILLMYDQYGNREAPDDELCYSNHGGKSYTLLDNSKNRIVYSAHFW